MHLLENISSVSVLLRKFAPMFGITGA